MVQADMQRRLARAFEPPQAAVLAEVIAGATGVAALSGEIATLTSSVNALAEAQARTESWLEALAEAQARTESRLEALAEAQARTESRLEALTARVDALVQVVQTLAESQRRFETRLGAMDGRLLELTYRDRAGAYFGRLLRRVRVVTPQQLEDGLESRVTPEQFHDLLLADLVLAGRPRAIPDAKEVWLAVEVSASIDEHDVARARRRAAILRQAGHLAAPAVAGDHLTPDAEAAARESPVLVLLDGRIFQWEETLAALDVGSPS